MEKPEESDTASELEHRHGNSVVGFECARLNRSIIIMQKEKAPIYKLSRSKAPKHSKFAITDMQEKPVDYFFVSDTGVEFSSSNNFANLVPLQNFPFL